MTRTTRREPGGLREHLHHAAPSRPEPEIVTAGNDDSLPPATSRRELRARERAQASAQPETAAPQAGFTFPTAPDVEPASRVRPAPAAPAAAAAVAAPRAVRTGNVRHTIASRLLSVAALASAGALVVGMSLPANVLGVQSADAAVEEEFIAASLVVEGQGLDVHEDHDAITVARDDFEVKSWAQVLRDKYGARNYSYSSNGSGAIRWPFPYTVPISSGYGLRAKDCGACSTDHRGIDFVPGAGAPIFAVADGVVVEREDHWSFGHTVVLEHRIDGQTVRTRYAHMQFGSSPLSVGQSVPVGEFIGLVGSTGVTTAPHLHFEVTVNGAHVDPFVWLQTHAG